MIAVTLYCDLSAAFDIVNHELILLYKLKHHGFNESTLKLMFSYLQHRLQALLPNSEWIKSLYKAIEVGAPQGSLLIPLLRIPHLQKWYHRCTTQRTRHHNTICRRCFNNSLAGSDIDEIFFKLRWYNFSKAYRLVL